MRGSSRGRSPPRMKSNVCKCLCSRRLPRKAGDFQAVRKVREDFFDSLGRDGIAVPALMVFL